MSTEILNNQTIKEAILLMSLRLTIQNLVFYRPQTYHKPEDVEECLDKCIEALQVSYGKLEGFKVSYGIGADLITYLIS